MAAMALFMLLLFLSALFYSIWIEPELDHFIRQTKRPLTSSTHKRKRRPNPTPRKRKHAASHQNTPYD